MRNDSECMDSLYWLHELCCEFCNSFLLSVITANWNAFIGHHNPITACVYYYQIWIWISIGYRKYKKVQNLITSLKYMQWPANLEGTAKVLHPLLVILLLYKENGLKGSSWYALVTFLLNTMTFHGQISYYSFLLRVCVGGGGGSRLYFFS